MSNWTEGMADKTITYEIENGLDAWRAIVQEIQKSRGIRLAQLRKIVGSQTKIAKVEDVANHRLKFGNASMGYVQEGGETPNDKEMEKDLLDFNRTKPANI